MARSLILAALLAVGCGEAFAKQPAQVAAQPSWSAAAVVVVKDGKVDRNDSWRHVDSISVQGSRVSVVLDGSAPGDGVIVATLTPMLVEGQPLVWPVIVRQDVSAVVVLLVDRDGAPVEPRSVAFSLRAEVVAVAHQ